MRQSASSQPLTRREREDGVPFANLDDQPVVLTLRKLAADISFAQLSQLELIELVDETPGELRRRVFGRPHAVLPQLGEHVVPIPERGPISPGVSRQRLP